MTNQSKKTIIIEMNDDDYDKIFEIDRKEKITEFIALMQQLGFSREEILALISDTMKGETS